MSGRPRRRRFLILAGLGLVGAVLFLPYLQATSPTPVATAQLVTFVGGSSILAALATWFGLGWADQAGLPMPLLRKLEDGAAATPATEPAQVRRSRSTAALLRALGVGLVIGAVGLALVAAVGADQGGGSFWVRALSAGFAAVTLELVLHLGIMSMTVRLTRSVALGIVVATLAYVAFHAAGVVGQPARIVALAVAGNGLAGLAFGWLYARDGFEYLVLAHAIGHLIAVGFSG